MYGVGETVSLIMCTNLQIYLLDIVLKFIIKVQITKMFFTFKKCMVKIFNHHVRFLLFW